MAKRTPASPQPPTLGERVAMVAGFGGWLGRKGDAPPGLKALWEGMIKLMAYVEAIEATKANRGLHSQEESYG